MSAARFLVKLAKPFLKPIFRVKFYGDRKLPMKKTLLVGNHLSGWDSVIFQVYCKTWISFVYKAEFRKSKFLSWLFDGMDHIALHRGEVDMAGTKSILRHLRDNKIVGLFPEGTRNLQVDCLQEFHTGAALFAIKTQSPVRPFYIWDKAKAGHKNYIMVGDEFTLEEYYGQAVTKEVLAEATEKIKQRVDDLRVKLNEILAAKGVHHRKVTEKEVEKLKKRKAALSTHTALTDAEQNREEGKVNE